MHIFHVCVFIMSQNNKPTPITESDISTNTASDISENHPGNTVKMSKVLCVEIKVFIMLFLYDSNGYLL
jgi:hypothetical protein